MLLSASCVVAQDWPQWRGANRDNKVTGFTAPKTWPTVPTQKWKVTVGLGEASPALVGGKVYVFARQGGDEVTSCIDAASGKVVWEDKYAAVAVTGPASGHPGPRSSPAVAADKICTFGVGGVLSCLDAVNGKVVWRKESGAWPQFFTASSPIIVDGKCIAYLGGRGNGAITAFDLASGEEKWKWTGEGPGYGSFGLMTVAGTKQIVTPTERGVVGIGVTDGKLLWQVPLTARYMNGTPIIDGQTVIYSAQGPGTVALKIEKQADGFAAKELWKGDPTHQYNTSVLKDGQLYGLSARRNFFCMNAQTGEVLWTDTTARGECGTVIDAGSVLLALTSDTELVAFKPGKAYAELAKMKVADTPTWAYPIISGNRVFVKDRDTLTLWTIE